MLEAQVLACPVTWPESLVFAGLREHHRLLCQCQKYAGETHHFHLMLFNEMFAKVFLAHLREAGVDISGFDRRKDGRILAVNYAMARCFGGGPKLLVRAVFNEEWYFFAKNFEEDTRRFVDDPDIRENPIIREAATYLAVACDENLLEAVPKEMRAGVRETVERLFTAGPAIVRH
jgi:hypothetical protein